VDAVDIPVIANGDIRDGEDALAVLSHTKAAGVMIGRAAQGNPWVFREINAALVGRPEPARPSTEEIGQALLTYLSGCHELYGDYRGVRIARKHIAWFCKGLRHATNFREKINTVEAPGDQVSMVETFFSHPNSFEAAA